MVNIANLQNKIEKKIFDALGSQYSFYSRTEGSVDKWGDQTEAFGSATTITVVPYSLYANRNSYALFGDLQEGEVDIVFKFNQALKVGDKLVLGSNTFIVKTVEEFPLKNENLVKIARLSKKL